MTVNSVLLQLKAGHGIPMCRVEFTLNLIGSQARYTITGVYNNFSGEQYPMDGPEGIIANNCPLAELLEMVDKRVYTNRAKDEWDRAKLHIKKRK